MHKYIMTAGSNEIETEIMREREREGETETATERHWINGINRTYHG